MRVQYGPRSGALMSKLDQLERQIEQFLETSLPKLIGAAVSPSQVALQLAHAMHESLRRNEEGKAFAPDKYAITFHPKDAKALFKQAPDLQASLARGLLEVAKNSGYLVFREPVVTLATDPTLSRREIRVIAWHSTSPLEFTQAMAQAPKTEPGKIPQGAYLIVDGKRHFPLDRTVVNIGRRLDNNLILEDTRVSRTHAQMRMRRGRYEIFDLGSSAGLRVNGRKVNRHILQPGDVINIAGIKLVYGEDPGGPPDETPAYKPPFPPRPAGDQRTHVIKRDNERKS